MAGSSLAPDRARRGRRLSSDVGSIGGPLIVLSGVGVLFDVWDAASPCRVGTGRIGTSVVEVAPVPGQR